MAFHDMSWTGKQHSCSESAPPSPDTGTGACIACRGCLLCSAGKSNTTCSCMHSSVRCRRSCWHLQQAGAWHAYCDVKSPALHHGLSSCVGSLGAHTCTVLWGLTCATSLRISSSSLLVAAAVERGTTQCWSDQTPQTLHCCTAALLYMYACCAAGCRPLSSATEGLQFHESGLGQRRDRPRLRSHRAPPRHGEAAESLQRGSSRRAGRAQLLAQTGLLQQPPRIARNAPAWQGLAMGCL